MVRWLLVISTIWSVSATENSDILDMTSDDTSRSYSLINPHGIQGGSRHNFNGNWHQPQPLPYERDSRKYPNHNLRIMPHKGTFPFESEVSGDGYRSKVKYNPFGSSFFSNLKNPPLHPSSDRRRAFSTPTPLPIRHLPTAQPNFGLPFYIPDRPSPPQLPLQTDFADHFIADHFPSSELQAPTESPDTFYDNSPWREENFNHQGHLPLPLETPIGIPDQYDTFVSDEEVSLVNEDEDEGAFADYSNRPSYLNNETYETNETHETNEAQNANETHETNEANETDEINHDTNISPLDDILNSALSTTILPPPISSISTDFVSFDTDIHDIETTAHTPIPIDFVSSAIPDGISPSFSDKNPDDLVGESGLGKSLIQSQNNGAVEAIITPQNNKPAIIDYYDDALWQEFLATYYDGDDKNITMGNEDVVFYETVSDTQPGITATPDTLIATIQHSEATPGPDVSTTVHNSPPFSTTFKSTVASLFKQPEDETIADFLETTELPEEKVPETELPDSKLPTETTSTTREPVSETILETTPKTTEITTTVTTSTASSTLETTPREVTTRQSKSRIRSYEINPISLAEVLQDLGGIPLPVFLTKLISHGTSLSEFTTLLKEKSFNKKDLTRAKGDLGTIISILKGEEVVSKGAAEKEETLYKTDTTTSLPTPAETNYNTTLQNNDGDNTPDNISSSEINTVQSDNGNLSSNPTTTETSNTTQSFTTVIYSTTKPLKPYKASSGAEVYRNKRPTRYNGGGLGIISKRLDGTSRPTLYPKYKYSSDFDPDINPYENLTTTTTPTTTTKKNKYQDDLFNKYYNDNKPDIPVNMSSESAIMAGVILGVVTLVVFLAILVVVMCRNHMQQMRHRIPLPISLPSDASSSSTPPIYASRMSIGKGPYKTAGFWGTLKKRFDPYSLSSTPNSLK